jgi:thymidylate synthase
MFEVRNNEADWNYLRLVNHVLSYGVPKEDRTGTGTLSSFGHQMRFDLTDRKIPLLTTKKMFTRGVIHEILWYLSGDTNIKYLQDNNVKIWDEWADENGELGPVYGEQWRRWKHVSVLERDWDYVEHLTGEETHFNAKIQIKRIDQLADAIRGLRNDPCGRRHIVSAWHVGEIEEMNLPPCHAFFQFWSDGEHLSCQLYQRSCDIGLGVPFNIVQYSILTHMVAQVTGLKPLNFIWTGGDVHIYNNHVEALKEQLLRQPYAPPRLKLNPDVKEIDDFKFEDFTIEGYECHPVIKMPVAV